MVKVLQLSYVNYQKGAFIIVEGDRYSGRFLIIQKGQVRCYRGSEPSSDMQEILGPGDFVGVVSCMSGHDPVQNVEALTDVVAISVRREQYPELIANNIPVALKIIRSFANRMRQLNERLTQLTLKNVVPETPEQLYDVAAYYEKIGKQSIAFFAYYHYIKACPDGYRSERAKKRFVMLKGKNKAVYLEPSQEMSRVYPQDTMIMAENQHGAEMFIIQDGKVKITKVVNGNEVTLAILKKGDMFGEMALLEDKPRSASAIAEEECHLLTVNRKNFDVMVSTQAPLIARLTTTFAERLWSMYRQLTNAQLSDVQQRLIDMLAIQVEKQHVPMQPNIPFRSELTGEDVANMCGIPQDIQGPFIQKLQKDPLVRLERGKLVVVDSRELVKRSLLYRKARHQH